MPSIAGLEWETMRGHVIVMELDGVTVRVLDLEGLMQTKQGLRPKDRMDAVVLDPAIRALSDGN